MNAGDEYSSWKVSRCVRDASHHHATTAPPPPPRADPTSPPQNMWRLPPDGVCLHCFDKDAFNQDWQCAASLSAPRSHAPHPHIPTLYSDPSLYSTLFYRYWWSPASKWPQFGVKTPCPNHGFAHSQYMKTYEWRQRKVKGVTGDFNLCYQRIRCSECEVEYNRRKKMLAAAKSHDAQDPRVAELQKELDGFDYNSTTIDPRVLK